MDYVYFQINLMRVPLCLERVADYSCLRIFSVVVNSAAFNEFIQEKQFAGAKSQALLLLLFFPSGSGPLPAAV